MLRSGRRNFLYACVLTANILAFTIGMTLTWTSPVLPKLEKLDPDNPFDEPISSTESSWIGSLLALGAGFGPFLAAACSDRLGRKITLLLLSLPVIFSYLCLAFTKEIILYYVARAVGGLSLGGTFAILPGYIAEVSEDDIRGVLGSSMNVFVVTGVLASYCIGPYLSITLFSVISAVFPIAFAILFFIFMPETPQFYLLKGRKDDARKSLIKLRRMDDVEEELKTMEAFLEENKSGDLRDVFTIRSNVKALMISVCLAAFQQLSGINIIQFYAQNIFETAGIKELPDEIPPIILGFCQFAAGFITPVIIDRFGRRILLLTSAIGMAVSQLPLGFYFYYLKEGKDLESVSWLPVLLLVLYMLTYGFGFGPLPWSIMGEIFPSNVKAPASSLTASICWLVCFFLTKFFTNASLSIGMGPTFWIFSAFNVVALAFTYFLVPETKGRSIEEIQAVLSK
ncbi:PREDICTED: facilitated trehalose transporter Tret1-like [Nicrophorus vespilloides]|uniref:Facilitated trehalose transporter Tret1-like n=1 Tax=Nicrophorus vespilloides TaxID=110193 RepID=A0ABM1NHZ4_NICVS|nr:PREDICTED: facilitated trehalose transporter Tret1-like [Nicrophorus vespilloides]